MDTSRQSLNRTFPQTFLDKTMEEAAKRLRSLCTPEFKAKRNKIHFEANNEILENVNQVISSIEKGNVEKCQDMLQNGKKLIRIADREEGGFEVVKCY